MFLFTSNNYDDDDDDEEFLTIGQIWTVSFSSRTKVSQTLQSVLTEKYFVCVLVVLLDARFSVVGPNPYIGSTTVLPDQNMFLFTSVIM